MRRSRSIAATPTILALALSTSISVGHAAPATSEELTAASDSRSAGSTGTPSTLPVVSAIPQSKSVELLLQLQDQAQQAATEGRGAATQLRKAPTPAPAPAVANPGASPPPEDPNPLAALKNSILRDAVPRQADTGATAQAPLPGAAERAGTTGQPTGSSQRQASGESLLSHPVVRYIRENRMTVVSICAAVLAGIWLTASFSFRRSR